MGKVISSATMSLDGFIANADHTVGHLFDWFDRGGIAVPSANPEVSFHLTATSVDYWRGWMASLGALLVGRELFDLTDGWHGTHPLGVPVVVLTHEPPTDWNHPGSEDFHFVTDGIASAVALARQLAGDRHVGAAAGTIARQCLQAGLLDEVMVDLVPLVMGTGRPYFGELTGGEPALLGNPTTVIRSDRVTHLVFPVLR